MHISDTNQHPKITNLNLSEDEIYLGIINKWLHLFFYDNYPDSAAIIPDVFHSTLYHFVTCAENLLKNNSPKAHTMLVFDCEEEDGSKDTSLFNKLTTYLDGFLQKHIQEPNLFCRLCDDTFVLLLEDCKEIDVAVLVIYLMEEVSGFDPEKKMKLTFGACKADPAEYNIHALYQKAVFAKNSIKGKTLQLLADYQEIMSKATAKG